MVRLALVIAIAVAFQISLGGCNGGTNLDDQKTTQRPPVPDDERRPAPGPGSAASTAGEAGEEGDE